MNRLKIHKQWYGKYENNELTENLSARVSVVLEAVQFFLDQGKLLEQLLFLLFESPNFL